MKNNSIILIGYSGHAFVAQGIFESMNKKVIGYCEKEEKSFNPFSISYYGTEESDEGLLALQQNDFFIAIGNNFIRRKIHVNLANKNLTPINAIHPSSIIDKNSTIHASGVMISAGVCINPLAKIGQGVICNTGSIIEHECMVKEFAHIAPGAVLCGNVTIGENAFIGANAVIKEGITIGENAIVGAGSVVIKNVTSNAKVAGNPSILLK